MKRAIPIVACAVVCVASAVVAQPRDQESSAAPRAGRAAGLHYQETVVGDGRASDPLPLVVALHQLGAGPRGAARVFDRGMECPTRVIAPRGSRRHPPGFSFIDAFASDPEDVLAPALRRGADRLARFVTEVRSERPTIGTTIVTGFSQGGMLTFALAALHPEVVGAAFPGAGTLPAPLLPPTEQLPPLVAFHGGRDSIVDPAGARRAVAHFRRRGGEARLVTYPEVGHRFTRPMQNALREWVSNAVCERYRSRFEGP